jgi:hypothetical protein
MGPDEKGGAAVRKVTEGVLDGTSSDERPQQKGPVEQFLVAHGNEG